jgi:hypothetical protein
LKAGMKTDNGTPMFIERWMYIQNIAHASNGILFSTKNQWNFSMFYNMNSPCRYKAKWIKSHTKGQVCYYFLHMWGVQWSQTDKVKW